MPPSAAASPDPESVSTPAEELDTFVDADTSLAPASTENDALQPPATNGVEHSPRSSSASEATHSGASAETALTADSFDLAAPSDAKRDSATSSPRSTSTIDEIPLDEVSLDDHPSPPRQRRSTMSSEHTDTPTQVYVPIASTSTAAPPSPLPLRLASQRASLPLSPVSLSASSFLDDPSDGASVDGTVGTSHLAKRRTMGSVASTSSGGNNNFDFLLQRINAQNALLDEDPKAKRRSALASDKLRRSFERLHNELADEDGLIDWDFWGAVMNDYEKVAREQPRELSRAIQKGIPDALRGMMWQLMSTSRDPELEATYSQLLKTPSPHEKSIIRDLARTFPSHEYFRDVEGDGQANLFNVVKAYSLYDEEVGYCQGLQFIVGPLLLNMPDEEAFCVLVRLMKSYDLRSHFIPDMPGLQLRLFQFDRLLEEHLPAVFMHLLRQGVKSSMYASQWFLTMLSYRFPLELVYSVQDLVFAEGVEAMLRFALALMKRNEDHILTLPFEKLLDFLKAGLYEVYRNPGEEDEAPTYSASKFVKDALQCKLSPAQLDQLAQEWHAMCRQRDAHSIELKRLRGVNSQLSNQVRKLEASLAQINEEHCDLVRQVVHARLEREEVEEELVKWKMAVANAGVELKIT